MAGCKNGSGSIPVPLQIWVMAAGCGNKSGPILFPLRIWADMNDGGWTWAQRAIHGDEDAASFEGREFQQLVARGGAALLL